MPALAILKEVGNGQEGVTGDRVSQELWGLAEYCVNASQVALLRVVPMETEKVLLS